MNIWWPWGKEDQGWTFSRHSVGLHQDKLQASSADPVPVCISFSYKPRWHRIWKQYCISFYPGPRNHPERICVYSHWWNKGSDCSLRHYCISCKTTDFLTLCSIIVYICAGGMVILLRCNYCDNPESLMADPQDMSCKLCPQYWVPRLTLYYVVIGLVPYNNL